MQTLGTDSAVSSATCDTSVNCSCKAQRSGAYCIIAALVCVLLVFTPIKLQIQSTGTIKFSSRSPRCDLLLPAISLLLHLARGLLRVYDCWWKVFILVENDVKAWPPSDIYLLSSLIVIAPMRCIKYQFVLHKKQITSLLQRPTDYCCLLWEPYWTHKSSPYLQGTVLQTGRSRVRYPIRLIFRFT
jgi:hypothetical protein